MKAWLCLLAIIAFLNLDRLGRIFESLPKKPARKRKKVRRCLP